MKFRMQYSSLADQKHLMIYYTIMRTYDYNLRYERIWLYCVAEVTFESHCPKTLILRQLYLFYLFIKTLQLKC